MKARITTKTTGMRITGIFILFVLSIACIASARAVPRAPEQYWGYVTAEGMIIPDGTKLTVESEDTGEVFVSQTIPFDAEYPGSYLFNLPFDDPATEEDEGAVPDEKLVFRVDSEYAISPEPGKDKAEPGKVNNNFTIKGTLDPLLNVSLNYSDDEPYVNDEMEIILSLENTGQGTALVKITKFSEEGLEILTGLPKSLEIAKGSSEIFDVDARPTECKEYSENWKTEYYNLAGTKIEEISKKVEFTAKGNDIVIEDIIASEDEVTEGELVDIGIEVSNDGDYNISSYTLEIYDNGDLVRTVDIDEDIDIGESAKKSYSLNLSVGEHEIRASAELDMEECNSVNNDGKVSGITVNKKIDKNAIAVNRTGDEILDAISFDMKLLNQTLEKNTLGIKFVNEDTNAKISELVDYKETVKDILESSLGTQEKNSTLIIVRQKLKSLEETFIYNINELGSKQYTMNSSFAEYVSENPGNFSSAEDLAMLYNRSSVTVFVRLVEIEYFSHEKSYLTMVNAVVNSTVPKENFELLADIPKEMAESASELVYESSYEVLMDDPVIGWASQKSIVFYAKKDAFDSAGNIEFALVPKASAADAVPLIQGFAVKSIDGASQGFEWSWNILFTMLLLVFVSSVLVYRARSMHAGWKERAERQRINRSFGPGKNPSRKARQKIIIRRRIGEKQMEMKAIGRKASRLSSGIPAGSKRQASPQAMPEPEQKPQAKRKKVTMRELYRRMEAVEKGEALHLPEEEKQPAKQAQIQPEQVQEEVRRPSPVPKARHAIMPGSAGKAKPVARRPVIKIRRYKPITMEELRREDDGEPKPSQKPGQVQQEQKPELEKEPESAEGKNEIAEEKPELKEDESKADELEELDSQLNKEQEPAEIKAEESNAEEIPGTIDEKTGAPEKIGEIRLKKKRRVHKISRAIRKKIGASKHRKEMLEKIKQNFDNSYHNDLEYDHSRMAELKKFPEPKRRIHAIAERIKKTSTKDKESIAAAKEELRKQAKKKRYEILLENMKKAREAKKQKKQLEKEGKAAIKEKAAEEKKVQKSSDAQPKTQKKAEQKQKRRYQAILDKLKKKDGDKKNDDNSAKNAPKKSSSSAKKGKRRYQVILEKIAGKREDKKAAQKNSQKK